jgi:2-keto-4-pentenoate hydratase/2-oxohepta-3-ene-1,7-dioic acid hydratase in catechol pathway
MKLVTYLGTTGPARGGILLDDSRILDLEAAGEIAGSTLPSGMLEFLGLGASGIETAARAVERAIRDNARTLASSDVQLLAPVPRPGKVLAVAGNYVAHIEESGQKALEKAQATVRPFIKPSNAVIGPDAPIQFPHWSDKLDYEAELAIVIGRHATAVSVEEAKDCIAGYSVFNDVSGRALTITENRVERPGDGFYDWLAGKWFDTFACLGPAIATCDEIDDPHDLQLTLDLNGERRQDTATSQLIFNCYEMVSYFSHLTTLEPGDVIATGTPSGVGAATGRYLKAGDVVEASIDAIGTLRNIVIARDDG